jgi:hypothetical protein
MPKHRQDQNERDKAPECQGGHTGYTGSIRLRMMKRSERYPEAVANVSEEMEGMAFGNVLSDEAVNMSE